MLPSKAVTAAVAGAGTVAATGDHTAPVLVEHALAHGLGADLSDGGCGAPAGDAATAATAASAAAAISGRSPGSDSSDSNDGEAADDSSNGDVRPMLATRGGAGVSGDGAHVAGVRTASGATAEGEATPLSTPPSPPPG